MEGKRFCRMDSMVVDCGHHLAREGDPGSRTLDYKRDSAPRSSRHFRQGEKQNHLPGSRVQRGLGRGGYEEMAENGHPRVCCNVRAKHGS